MQLKAFLRKGLAQQARAGGGRGRWQGRRGAAWLGGSEVQRVPWAAAAPAEAQGQGLYLYLPIGPQSRVAGRALISLCRPRPLLLTRVPLSRPPPARLPHPSLGSTDPGRMHGSRRRRRPGRQSAAAVRLGRGARLDVRGWVWPGGRAGLGGPVWQRRARQPRGGRSAAYRRPHCGRQRRSADSFPTAMHVAPLPSPSPPLPTLLRPAPQAALPCVLATSRRLRGRARPLLDVGRSRSSGRQRQLGSGRAARPAAGAPPPRAAALGRVRAAAPQADHHNPGGGFGGRGAALPARCGRDRPHKGGRALAPAPPVPSHLSHTPHTSLTLLTPFPLTPAPARPGLHCGALRYPHHGAAPGRRAGLRGGRTARGGRRVGGAGACVEQGFASLARCGGRSGVGRGRGRQAGVSCACGRCVLTAGPCEQAAKRPRVVPCCAVLCCAVLCGAPGGRGGRLRGLPAR